MKWTGSFVALVTPFTKDNQIDIPALEYLLDWQLKQGSDGLVLCGTTGEGNLLTREEKLLIFQTAKQIIGEKIPLIAATGSNNTQESVLLTKEAKKRGIDGCLAIVPYYVRPSFEGCYRHFSAITSVGLPTIVYHHPKRTGVRLTSKELMQICTLPNIAGIKDACGDLYAAMQLREIPHFSGDDLLSLAQFSIGFVGSISVIGNLIPNQWKTFVDWALEGNLKKARETFFNLYQYCQAMTLETNPQCIKYALSLFNKCQPYFRLPLCLPRKENQREIERVLAPALNENREDFALKE